MSAAADRVPASGNGVRALRVLKAVRHAGAVSDGLPEPADRRPTPWWRSTAVWLTGVVLLAAGLRLWRLDSPGIWGDEAATYGRVNGTYGELLAVLEFDGFMPLHYQLYWLLARWVTLDPVWLRLWPAVTGLATVPAMYLLARQLMTARAAVLAALLAATSAYLLYYSRDAKMYAPLWLFVTLSMACFLAWAGRRGGESPRERRDARLWFWGWVASSMAAAGIHAPALLVVAVQPVMLPVLPGRSWKKAAAMCLGLGLIVAGPAVHYGVFNRWHEQIREYGWGASMLQWVEWYNRGRDLPELVRFTATAYATAWEWPDRPQDRDLVDPVWLQRLQWTCIGIGAAVVAGVLPWRRLWAWCQAALRRPPAGDGGGSAPDAIAWWKVFVVSVWAVVPSYGVYAVSVASPAPPWRLGAFLVSGPWVMAVAAAVVVGVALSLRSWRDAARGVATAAALLGLCLAVYAGVWVYRHYSVELASWAVLERNAVKPPNMLWMPRYLGVVYPAVLLAGVALLMRLPVGLRGLAVAGVVAVNLTNFGVKVWLDPEPPVGRVIAELWEDRQSAAAGVVRRLSFLQAPFGPGFEPGTGTISGPVGRYYYSIRLPKPLSPPEFRQAWAVVERGLGVRSDLRPRAVRDAVNRAGASLERVVLWERGDARATPGRDPLGQTLGGDWTLQSVETWNTYDHWMWRRLAQIRRFEYVRRAAAAAADP